MPHYLQGLAGSPWVLVVVFLVAGLDAVLPFMPSESTVVAVGVVAAGTGRPHLAALIGAAAGGAYLGDRLSYLIGRRSNRALLIRLQRGRRARAVHEWVHRLLHSRGGLVIVFARYVPVAGRPPRSPRGWSVIRSFGFAATPRSGCWSGRPRRPCWGFWAVPSSPTGR
jgi:membrane-associated protein